MHDFAKLSPNPNLICAVLAILSQIAKFKGVRGWRVSGGCLEDFWRVSEYKPWLIMESGNLVNIRGIKILSLILS